MSTGRRFQGSADAAKQRARGIKAARLAECFAHHLRTAAGGDVDALTIAEVADIASTQVWHDVAELNEIRRPSQATIGAAIGILVGQAKRPVEDDPFAGL